MTVACPAGHQSNDPDWCDVCGARIGAAPPAPDPAHVPPTAPTLDADPHAADPVVCPNCTVLNPPDNLFCEGCGYDFTTGQAPPAADPQAGPEPPTPMPVGGPDWLVVVEVSPEWYALKGSLADQPCPPPSTSTIRLVGHTSLVGRTSQSKGIRPEVALDQDTGVSRRHAQFVRDGEHMTIVDLSSTNGTSVVYHGEAPSDDTPAITPGVATAIDDGDAVFLGAWTKLTLRRSATA